MHIAITVLHRILQFPSFKYTVFTEISLHNNVSKLLENMKKI